MPKIFIVGKNFHLMTRTRNTNIKTSLEVVSDLVSMLNNTRSQVSPGICGRWLHKHRKDKKPVFIQLNRAPFFVLKRQFFTLHGFHREAVAVGNVQRFIVTRYHNLIARRQFGADCLVYRQLGVYAG